MKGSLQDRIAFFRQHMGYSYPAGATPYVKGRERTRQARELALAEMRAEALDLKVVNEDELEAWDNMPGETAPEYVFCVCVYGPEDDNGKREFLDSLGMVGVNRLDDPYLRVVAAELCEQALATLDARFEKTAQEAANELAARATFAGVQP
jgi:hypothetical protein